MSLIMATAFTSSVSASARMATKGGQWWCDGSIKFLRREILSKDFPYSWEAYSWDDKNLIPKKEILHSWEHTYSWEVSFAHSWEAYSSENPIAFLRKNRFHSWEVNSSWRTFRIPENHISGKAETHSYNAPFLRRSICIPQKINTRSWAVQIGHRQNSCL